MMGHLETEIQISDSLLYHLLRTVSGEMAGKQSAATRLRGWMRRFLPKKRKYGGEDTISVRTLRMMDTAMENFDKGKVGPPIDPERLKKLAS